MTASTKRCCTAIFFLFLGVTVANDVAVAESASSTDSTNRLLVVVTDDDFLETSQPIWCHASLQESVDACREQRRATTLKVETIHAGSPSILRGGQSLTGGPRRVICLICDSERRVLSCCVGVPNTRQLLGLSEDADELSVLMTLAKATEPHDEALEHTVVATSLTDTVRERASNRVTRHYRPLLPSIQRSLSIEDSANLIADALASDIKERFLFDSPVESERWISAQQHAEARRHWCETMLVGFVGKSVDEIWPQLAASVWGAAPWRVTENVQQFATECSETLQQRSLVLELDLSTNYIHSQSIIRPVASAENNFNAPVANREAALAKALEAAQAKMCDLCELSVLLQKLNRPPITLLNPKTRTTRWIVFKSADREPSILPDGAENRLMDIVNAP